MRGRVVVGSVGAFWFFLGGCPTYSPRPDATEDAGVSSSGGTSGNGSSHGSVSGSSGAGTSGSGPASSSAARSSSTETRSSSSVGSSSATPPSSGPESSSSAAAPSSSQAAASSSSAAPSSSAASSSSSAGATSSSAAPELALEELCPALADGYRRWLVSARAGTEQNWDALPDLASCSLLPDEDLLTFFFGSQALYRDVMCAPGGRGQVAVEGIAASINAGRALYRAREAAACLAAGRAQRQDAGLLRTVHALGNQPEQGRPGLCASALVGLQATGQPCARDYECDSSSGSAYCAQRHGEGGGCMGTCQPSGVLGSPCKGTDVGISRECAPGLSCQAKVCAPLPALGSACSSVDSCPSALACLEGTCQERRGDGGACGADLECALDLYCSPADGRCHPRLAQGQTCEGGHRSCQSCLACVSADGVALPTCVAAGGAGDGCLDRPCRFPLLCVVDQCVVPARSGAPCQEVDGEDPSQRGTCLDPDDACVGTPLHCAPRAAVGQACVSRPGPVPMQGSCARTVLDPLLPLVSASEQESHTTVEVCARSGPSARDGTCTPASQPVDGGTCGNLFYATPHCRTPAGLPAECTASPESGLEGVCVYRDQAPRQAPCTADIQCQDGLYCAVPTGGEIGSCTVGPAPGQPCGVPTTRCQAGFCGAQDNGDGGVEQRCQGYLSIGARCDGNAQCYPSDRCLAVDAGIRLCRPRAMAGEACQDARDCEDGNWCMDHVCTPALCAPQPPSGCLNIQISCADSENLLPLLLFMGTLWQGKRWARRAR